MPKPKPITDPPLAARCELMRLHAGASAGQNGPLEKICIKAGESTSSTRRKPALRLAQTPMSMTGRRQARVSTTILGITIQHSGDTFNLTQWGYEEISCRRMPTLAVTRQSFLISMAWLLVCQTAGKAPDRSLRQRLQVGQCRALIGTESTVDRVHRMEYDGLGTFLR